MLCVYNLGDKGARAWEGDGFPEAITVEFCGKLCPPWQNSGSQEQGLGGGYNIFEKQAYVAKACLKSDAGQVGTQFTTQPSWSFFGSNLPAS